MPKRYRTLQAKSGELRAYYGKADRWSGPDVCCAWGPGTERADARLLHNVISGKRLTLKFPEGGTEYEPSLMEELEARGYDISTLRFSIQRKAAVSSRADEAKEKT